MKLGQRLTTLASMADGHYDQIWDCCCDHGYLGAQLLKNQHQAQIHFVDIVPTLIGELAAKLEQFMPQYSGRWHTHCLDVAKLPVEKFPGHHLIIIAGIGGDLMLQMLHSIFEQHPDLSADFLLCPVHHQYKVRQLLLQKNCRLIDERLIKENQRFYEMIKVSTTPRSPADTQRQPLSETGTKIWHWQDQQQKLIALEYRQKTIEHYRRMRSGISEREQIIKAYSDVEI